MRITLNSPARLPILSQTGEHALRAVLFLARHRSRGLISATDIAEALGAPPNYLSKTLRTLARRGLLRSVRGAQGGFELRIAPEDLTAEQVVSAVDDVRITASCLMGDGPCDPDHPCEAHARWSALTARVLQPMAETTIADLIGGGRAASPNVFGITTPSR